MTLHGMKPQQGTCRKWFFVITQPVKDLDFTALRFDKINETLATWGKS